MASATALSVMDTNRATALSDVDANVASAFSAVDAASEGQHPGPVPTRSRQQQEADGTNNVTMPGEKERQPGAKPNMPSQAYSSLMRSSSIACQKLLLCFFN